MQIPKELKTVTTLSKSVALIMFVTLPIIAFLFGMRYQTAIIEQNNQIPSIISPTPVPVACTLEAKICPDGSLVGRIPPNCEFEKCISQLIDDSSTQTFCGGIAGKKCQTGYYCKYDGAYPDAGGTCIKEAVQTKYVCPKNGWVNCMPVLDETAKQACSKEASEWYKMNCPDFKGLAY